jgi:hypothetical protein
MRGYLLYSLLVLAGFALWVILFAVLRRSRGRLRDATGFFFLGPFHSYMRSRNYSLSKRELVGWGVVLVVMLLAPWLSWWLTK